MSLEIRALAGLPDRCILVDGSSGHAFGPVLSFDAFTIESWAEWLTSHSIDWRSIPEHEIEAHIAGFVRLTEAVDAAVDRIGFEEIAAEDEFRRWCLDHPQLVDMIEHNPQAVLALWQDENGAALPLEGKR